MLYYSKSTNFRDSIFFIIGRTASFFAGRMIWPRGPNFALGRSLETPVVPAAWNRGLTSKLLRLLHDRLMVCMIMELVGNRSFALDIGY